jgi:hypothetical protein
VTLFLFHQTFLKKGLQNNHKSQRTKVMDMDVNGNSFLALLGFLDLYWQLETKKLYF